MLTVSLSWDLESPCSFDHFEVATVGASKLVDVHPAIAGNQMIPAMLWSPLAHAFLGLGMSYFDTEH